MRLSTIAKHSVVESEAPTLRELGVRLRSLRRAAGLTQAQVAGPFSSAYVSAIEGGKVVPSLAALVLLAGNMGLSAAEVLAGVKSLAPGAYTAEHVETTEQPHFGVHRDQRVRRPPPGGPPHGRADAGEAG